MTQFELVVAGMGFVLIFLSGYWLSRLAQPVNAIVLTVHKLIAVATIAYLVVTVLRISKIAPPGQTEWIACIVAALLFLVTIASGGWLSAVKNASAIVRTLHRILPFLTVISVAAFLYLQSGADRKNSGNEENSLMEEQTIITTDMVHAAEEVYDFLFLKLNSQTGIHVGTFVSAAARLAGTCLFRSFELKLPDAKPGMAVLSEEANVEGPKLMDVMFRALQVMKVKLNKKGYMETPKGHLPQLSVIQMQAQLQGGYNKIMKKYNLDLVQSAYAGAFACAIVINETKDHLDPNISTGIAIMGFIEGCKTVPEPLTTVDGY
jgi:hypothetical protein